MKFDSWEKIKALAEDRYLRHKIVLSIAPGIIGYDPIMEAVALQLFGCPSLELPCESFRGEMHILIVSDPRTIKTRLLRWAAEAAFSGVYILGTADTELDARALASAPLRLLCIDDLDEMGTEEIARLSRIMRDQIVTVNGELLRTQISILAAARPEFGRYDSQGSLAEQVKLPPAILSRFDLILIARDEPHEERDKVMARSVLEPHYEPGKAPERLDKPPFDIDTLNKIIVYANTRIHPTFKDRKPAEMLEDIFVKWRKSSMFRTHISAMQLEGLIRLSKACARMRLSNTVTVEDAVHAIGLMNMYLLDIFR